MKWQIGEWTACSDSDTVRREGTQHKIERRAMEALELLAANAGNVVKKEELIETVWGRLAVSDHSVAMVISQLRRAFGDDARAPIYIETITKRGYRLIASCERVAEVPTPATRATGPDRIAPVGPQTMVVLVSAGVALAGVGALSALLLF
jgi:DNA-binding winged helix-turn-helix (wHTH) protein